MTDLEIAIQTRGEEVFWLPRPSGEKFYLRNEPYSPPWIPLSLEALKDHLDEAGVTSSVRYDKVEQSLEISKNAAARATKENLGRARANLFTQFINHIRRTKSVSWVGDVAGLPSGFHEQNRKRLLVINGLKLPETIEGDCGFIDHIMEHLFDDEQRPYVLAWLQHVFTSLKNQEEFYAQALCVAGESGNGKSLFQKQLVTGLLGGRWADASHHLSNRSNSHFNADLCGAEHWMIDDKTGGHDFDQLAYTEKMKEAVSNPIMRVEGKGDNAIILRLKRAITVMMNTGSYNMSLMTADTADMEGKVILVKSTAVPGLGPVSENNRIIKEQMSAWAYKIEHYEAPAHTIGFPRYHVQPYLNPELDRARWQESTEHELEVMLKWFLVHFLNQKKWTGTAGELFHALQDARPRSLDQIAKSARSLGRRLGDLVRKKPDLVSSQGVFDGYKVWDLHCDVLPENQVGGAKVIAHEFTPLKNPIIDTGKVD